MIHCLILLYLWLKMYYRSFAFRESATSRILYTHYSIYMYHKLHYCWNTCILCVLWFSICSVYIIVKSIMRIINSKYRTMSKIVMDIYVHGVAYLMSYYACANIIYCHILRKFLSKRLLGELTLYTCREQITVCHFILLIEGLTLNLMKHDKYNTVLYMRSGIVNFRNICIYITNVLCYIDQLYYCNRILLLYIFYKRLCMLLSTLNIYFMKGLPYISSCIYCILYCYIYTPIKNHTSISLNSYLCDNMKKFSDFSDAKCYTNIFRSSGTIHDSFVLFPVRNAYSKDTPPLRHRVEVNHVIIFTMDAIMEPLHTTL